VGGPKKKEWLYYHYMCYVWSWGVNYHILLQKIEG
jgi:hypothetical protein